MPSCPDRARRLPHVRLHLLLPLFALCLAAPAAGAQPAWTSVSVGDDHACALDAAGRAYCWGNNHAAQLGARTPVHCGIVSESGHRSCYPTANDTVPQLAAGGMRFASISAGRYLTCGVDPAGRAFCWGDAMGDTAAYRDRCLDSTACSFAPVPLVPARRFVAVEAGERCAVPREGTALCWGFGRGEEARSSTPWPMAVAAVAGDVETHTRCAVTRDHRAYCLGNADFGVLGNGGADSAAAPPADGRFTQVAVLSWWVCGLDEQGAAHCWGAAGYADARRGQTRPGFDQCERNGTQTWCNWIPEPVAGGRRFRSVTAMPRSTMPMFIEMVGLTPTGEAWVWGGDRVPKRWHPEHRWTSVSAADWGQCGVTTGGELFCWGRNPHEVVQGRVPHPR